MNGYTYNNADENRFWLQAMGESAEILYSRLVPGGPDPRQAHGFSKRFEDIYNRAAQTLNAQQLAALNRDAFAATNEFRTFVISVLRGQVIDGLFVNLKPIFINNLISVAEMYLYILQAFLNNQTPRFNPIDHDVFWLPVFYIESRLVSDSLGYSPVNLRERSENIASRIVLLFQSAVGLQKAFRRLGVNDFPIAREHRTEIRNILSAFAELVVDIRGRVRENRLPGTLTLVDLDYIYRKLCYYNTQLAAVDNLPRPACDPGAPRLSTM